MQPTKRLANILEAHADGEHYLFSFADLRVALPDLAEKNLRVLLSRAAKQGILTRVCQGIYIREQVMKKDGLLLFHAAAKLRAGAFNYISLETALSDAGAISQIPMQWITIMSSGRSQTFDCGRWGGVEFVHTENTPNGIAPHLTYDKRCGIWRANVELALRDMKRTHRSLDLIDERMTDDLVRQPR
jgi:hypothetical protein